MRWQRDVYFAIRCGFASLDTKQYWKHVLDGLWHLPPSLAVFLNSLKPTICGHLTIPQIASPNNGPISEEHDSITINLAMLTGDSERITQEDYPRSNTVKKSHPYVIQIILDSQWHCHLYTWVFSFIGLFPSEWIIIIRKILKISMRVRNLCRKCPLLRKSWKVFLNNK